MWDWVQLMRRNPDSVHVVSVHPPKGFIIRRDAVVTVDVADEGQTTRKDQGFPIPWMPAFLWRVAGKVPTPIGKLTDKRDLNAKVWGRRGERGLEELGEQHRRAEHERDRSDRADHLG